MCLKDFPKKINNTLVAPADEGGQERTRKAILQNRFNGSMAVLFPIKRQYLRGSKIFRTLSLNALDGKTVSSWTSQAARIPGNSESSSSAKSIPIDLSSKGSSQPTLFETIFAKMWCGVIAFFIFSLTASFKLSQRMGLEERVSHDSVASQRFEESDCMMFRLWATMSSCWSMCDAPSLICLSSRMRFSFVEKRFGASSRISV